MGFLAGAFSGVAGADVSVLGAGASAGAWAEAAEIQPLAARAITAAPIVDVLRTAELLGCKV
jgi:hypothetical protein